MKLEFALISLTAVATSSMFADAATIQSPITDTNAATSFPVTIQVDVTNVIGELQPIWRFFGADEPNYATMKDGPQTDRGVR
jgi:hypothetical protein